MKVASRRTHPRKPKPSPASSKNHRRSIQPVPRTGRKCLNARTSATASYPSRCFSTRQVGSETMTLKTLATAVVALGLGTAVLHGQAQPKTFFKDKIQLPDAEIQKIQQGQVVTKVLESGDAKYGMLVFGAVYVNASVDRFAAVVKDFPALLQNKVYLKVQEFSTIGAPPKPADFA